MAKRATDRAAAIAEAWRRERPDLDGASILVVTRVWHLAKVFSDNRRRLLAELGIDAALMDLLGTLRRSGAPYALTTRELTDRALLTPGAISQRVARAEERGWVMRAKGPGRTVVVTLTSEGRSVVDRCAGAIFGADEHALAGLSPRERHQLERLLGRLTSSLGAAGPLPDIGA